MRILRWLFAIIAILVVCGLGGLLVFFYLLNPKVKPAPAVTAPKTAEAIARGKYLAENVAICMSCHSPGDADKPGDPTKPGMLGGGRDFGDMQGFPGRVRAPNLTPDPKAGLANLTDGEIMRAIREGVDKAGKPIFPMMPYLTYGHYLSDEDTLAIVAYLRSLAPVANDPGPMEVKFPVSMFVRAAPRPVEKPAAPEPPASDLVARGNWLLDVASCTDCHSTRDSGQVKAGMRLAGNEVPFEYGGDTIYAANITSDTATGIGGWTDGELLRLLNEGVAKDGKAVYVMPWPYYKGMTDEDKRAIVAALRKVPPVAHSVPQSKRSSGQ